MVAIGSITGATDPILDPAPFTTQRETSEAYFGVFWSTIFVTAVYGAASEATVGLTAGKFIVGIRSAGAAGEAITRGRAMMRNIAKLASIYIFGIGLVWAVADRRHRTWHDLMAGSWVIDDR